MNKHRFIAKCFCVSANICKYRALLCAEFVLEFESGRCFILFIYFSLKLKQKLNNVCQLELWYM